jgi:Sds3-like protein
LLAYNLENLTSRTSADRQQLHSQYYQEIRQIREDAIKGCYQEIYSLQRDRWRFGSADRASLPLYNPKRSDQLLRQTAINLEVSLLSGIARYVGFPGAPDMSELAQDDISRDMQLMGV